MPRESSKKSLIRLEEVLDETFRCLMKLTNEIENFKYDRMLRELLLLERVFVPASFIWLELQRSWMIFRGCLSTGNLWCKSVTSTITLESSWWKIHLVVGILRRKKEIYNNKVILNTFVIVISRLELLLLNNPLH